MSYKIQTCRHFAGTLIFTLGHLLTGALTSRFAAAGTPDTMPPTVPTGLSATVINHARVDLAWTASTDDTGIYFYVVLRNGVDIHHTSGTSVEHLDTSLLPGTMYTYAIRACDSSGNCSAASTPVSVTTPLDTMPDIFYFTSRHDEPRHTLVASAPATITGIGGPAPLSITGGEYSIDGGPYTNQPGSVLNNQVITVRQVSSPLYNTSTIAVLNVGAYTANFYVTTVPMTPPSSTIIPSAPGNSWLMRRNGVEAATTIAAPRIIDGKQTFGLQDGFDGTTRYFSGDAYNLYWHGTQYPTGPVAGCGMQAARFDTYYGQFPVLANYYFGTGSAFHPGTQRIDTGACGFADFFRYSYVDYTMAERVTVPAGHFDAAKVRVAIELSGPHHEITYRTFWFVRDIGIVKEIDVDGVTRELVATNIVRNVPDAFSIAPRSQVPIGVQIVSAPVVISGINVATDITVHGGEYSIDGGAYTSAIGSVSNGQSVRLRLTAAAQPLTDAAATLYVGGVAGAFTVRTGDSSLLAVRSRKMHAGVPRDIVLLNWVDLDLDLGVEPRMADGTHQLFFQFPFPVSTFGAPVTADLQGMPVGNAVAAISPASANEVIVTLSGIADGKRARVTIPAINGGGGASANLGFLAGDINRSGSVTAVDIGVMKVRRGDALATGNAMFDLNTDGRLDADDVAAVKARAGGRLN